MFFRFRIIAQFRMKLALPNLFLLSALSIATALYSNDPGIEDLDRATFEKKVPGSGIWLIEFFKPSSKDSDKFAPVWREVARALDGVIHVAAVDAESHTDLAGQYSTKGFPSIKLLSGSSAPSLSAVEFKGDRSSKSIIEWALSEANKIALRRIGAKPGKEGGKKKESKSAPPGFYGPNSGYAYADVISLTDATFHEEVSDDSLWMVEFYAPWCGHCKNLKSEWEELATNVKGKAKIAAVDCTAEKATCQEFGIQGYPTIKFFGEDKDSPSDYQGGRESSSLISFIMAEWKKNQPPPEAKELVDQHVFEKECVGDDEEPAKKLCLLAFLPNILDTKAAGRLAYIKIMNGLADKYADRPFSYLWVEGGAQLELESALEVGGYGYPAFVALNPKDGKFASLREAFDAPNVDHFVESLRSGHERVSSLKEGIPEAVNLAPWDGGDGQEVQEDEFSLEDLMGDDDTSKSEL